MCIQPSKLKYCNNCLDIAMAFSIHSIHNFHHKSSDILPCDFGKYLDQSYHILGGCTISCDMCFMSACSLDNPQTYQIDWQGWVSICYIEQLIT